ncbi:hypothetical protein [Agromyces marinus]|uniref:Uncharacterized protein n=1 Tax=Agromyces marinus TaxID=1389020 RepID=A0ABN6YER2_9MICO|nr:hypothetical protein [Agromyces marinus]UIP59301.1 hypothetical protein DSM26151_22050 [Agromyces marinus]BDZ55678.1 hypothetical protein GCM10025870_27510 [Agromyces marinus]
MATDGTARDETSGASGGLVRWGAPITWALALLGTALVVGLAWDGRHVWFGDAGPYAALAMLGIVLAASVIAGLLLQLASRQPRGYVGRVSASIAGAVVVVAVGTLALLPVLL